MASILANTCTDHPNIIQDFYSGGCTEALNDNYICDRFLDTNNTLKLSDVCCTACSYTNEILKIIFLLWFKMSEVFTWLHNFEIAKRILDQNQRQIGCEIPKNILFLNHKLNF